MVLDAPCYNFYLHNYVKPPILDHQKLMKLISTTVICAPNLDNTPPLPQIPVMLKGRSW